MRKTFSYLGVATLISLSLLISEQTTTVVKNIDKLMTEIKQNQETYEIKPQNAIIKENTIIPGLNGKRININQTYEEMKKIGNFNSKYIKYEQVKPEQTIENIYDKYIISGNYKKNTITLIFLLQNDEDVEKIKQTLNNTQTQATFFINKKWLDKNKKQTKELIKQGNTIENIENIENSIEYRIVENTIKTKTEQTKNFCYTQEKNQIKLEQCASKKKYTIIPNIRIHYQPLKEIKKQLKPGALIEIPISEQTNAELELIINYIKYKGYNIKNLEEHISEKNNN